MKFYVTSQYKTDKPWSIESNSFKVPLQGSSKSSISNNSNMAVSPEIVSEMERSSAHIRTFNMSA